MVREHVYKNRILYVVVTITFLLYLYISSQIPYMLDDWNWGIEAGITSFFTCDQNSRFAGNLVILLITRSTFLKTLLMAVVETSIPILMVILCGFDGDADFIKKYLICNILVLSMPVSVWSQTFGWASGFANFVTSAMVLLIHISIIKSLVFSQTESYKKSVSAKKIVAMFCFAFAAQLFIENLSIYFLVLYLCVSVYFLIKEKRQNLYATSALAGIAVGTVLMFSSSIYDSLISTGTAYDGYRNVAVDTSNGLIGMISSILHTFGYGCVQQITLNLKLPSILLLLLSISLLITKQKKLWKLLTLVNLATLAIYIVVWFVGVFIPYRYKIFFSLGYFCLILLNVFFVFWNDKKKVFFVAFMWCSVIAVVFPLAVTTTTGERLWLAPLILTYAVILQMASELLALLNFKNIRVHLAVLGIAVCCLSSCYVVVYTSIGNTNRERLQVIQEAVASDSGEIHLPAYRYEEYLCGADPVYEGTEIKEKWPRDYKYFYGIPQEYELFVDKS